MRWDGMIWWWWWTFNVQRQNQISTLGGQNNAWIKSWLHKQATCIVRLSMNNETWDLSQPIWLSRYTRTGWLGLVFLRATRILLLEKRREYVPKIMSSRLGIQNCQNTLVVLLLLHDAFPHPVIYIVIGSAAYFANNNTYRCTTVQQYYSSRTTSILLVYRQLSNDSYENPTRRHDECACRACSCYHQSKPLRCRARCHSDSRLFLVRFMLKKWANEMSITYQLIQPQDHQWLQTMESIWHRRHAAQRVVSIHSLDQKTTPGNLQIVEVEMQVLMN